MSNSHGWDFPAPWIDVYRTATLTNSFPALSAMLAMLVLHDPATGNETIRMGRFAEQAR